MKKIYLLSFVALTLFSSCATVLGGKVNDCQRTKPLRGEASRAIRIIPLIADIIIFPPLLIIDFVTGAIFKPCENLQK